MTKFLDIETNSAHTKIWVCCIEDRPFYTPEGIKEFIGDSNVVAHNGIAFDFYLLKQLWGVDIAPEKQIDTLVMSRLHNPEREGGHSLEAWGNTLGYPKQEYSEFDNPDMDKLVSYCLNDVKLLEKVYNTLVYLLRNEGFSDKSIQLEHEAARVLAQQERTGWQVDISKVLELRASFMDEQKRIEKQLQEMFPPTVHKRTSEKTGKPLKDKVEVFNPGSRKQIIKRLQMLGWVPSKKTEKGNFTLDEEVLDEIIRECSQTA